MAQAQPLLHRCRHLPERRPPRRVALRPQPVPALLRRMLGPNTLEEKVKREALLPRPRARKCRRQPHPVLHPRRHTSARSCSVSTRRLDRRL